ncbi:hypothetical protein [Deinococcus ficus]|uniref:Uncharacterized protein n=1 Tax=Deinococcus ficus TaxID=317577 RepID=A0A221T315_9DEIO|nr:hypothetical protein [Deinococcus ficus]ASN83261.1 hypothetical protein DFI_18865 [Deinococcus ficus]
MSAKIQILGCLQHLPREKSFTVAGVEETNQYGRLQQVPFEFRVLKPELLGGAKPGDTLLIEARLQPISDAPGQLLLIPSAVQNLGNQGGTHQDKGHVRPLGLQRVLVAGTLAQDPVVQDFGKAGVATKLQLAINPAGALIQAVAYGESAVALGKRKAGDRLVAGGRLIAESTIDPRGRETTHYTFELDRQDVELAADFKRRTERPRKGKRDQQGPRTPGQAPTAPASPQQKRERRERTAPAPDRVTLEQPAEPQVQAVAPLTDAELPDISGDDIKVSFAALTPEDAAAPV